MRKNQIATAALMMAAAVDIRERRPAVARRAAELVRRGMPPKSAAAKAKAELTSTPSKGSK